MCCQRYPLVSYFNYADLKVYSIFSCLFLIKDFEINLLAGQTVNLKLSFIKDLNFFRGSLLGCGTMLPCSYKNKECVSTHKRTQRNTRCCLKTSCLELYETLSSEFKMLYESKDVMVLVENITLDNM